MFLTWTSVERSYTLRAGLDSQRRCGEVKQTLDRPAKVEVLTIRTDDVGNTGVSLAKNGAVFLGLNSSNDTESFYLLQGHLILVSKKA